MTVASATTTKDTTTLAANWSIAMRKMKEIGP